MLKIIEKYKRYTTRKKLQKLIQPIKTADIMTFAFETKPMLARQNYDAVGKLFEVNMQSGKVALYKCTNYEPALNVDWGWYYLVFWDFKKEEK